MGWIADALLVILVVIGILAVAFYFLNKWSYKKMDENQAMIERHRQSATIFVIDKTTGRLKDGILPKAAVDQMPRHSKFLKMYFVKAKVGPQIVTLVCEKNVYAAIPVKKNVKVELAGIYISSMYGMKTKEEMKEIKKAKSKKER